MQSLNGTDIERIYKGRYVRDKGLMRKKERKNRDKEKEIDTRWTE